MADPKKEPSEEDLKKLLSAIENRDKPLVDWTLEQADEWVRRHPDLIPESATDAAAFIERMRCVENRRKALRSRGRPRRR